MAELTTLARPYARAAFESALAETSLADWSQVLAFLAVASSDPKVGQLLGSPRLTAGNQVAMLVDLASEQVTISQSVKNFLGLLAEQKRLPLLPQIAVLFEILRAEQEKSVDVTVTSAHPLSQAQLQKITEALYRRVNKSLHIQAHLDSALIGGVTIRAGDLVIDGSVKGKLSRLAEAMNT